MAIHSIELEFNLHCAWQFKFKALKNLSTPSEKHEPNREAM